MSFENVTACPLCQHNSFSAFLTCKDFTTSGELFHVERCDSCGMVFTNPRPTQEDAVQYYQSAAYISHTSAAAGIIDYIYLIIRRFTVRWKYRLVKPYLTDNLLLDIGSGTGHFLNFCSSKGIDAHGMDPSHSARTVSNNKNVVDSLAKLPTIQFNVITLWHVIEHVYDLRLTITELKARLKENGTIFIAVPNLESFDATVYQELWAAYDVPRHLWHFSKASMTTLIESEGLKVKQVIPMKLDAYYVSMLSEKNKNYGKLRLTSLANAVMTGFRSNMKGRKNQNHSSLIYLIQK